LYPNSSSPFALAMNLNDMEDLHFGHCGAFIAAACGLLSVSDMTAFPHFSCYGCPVSGPVRELITREHWALPLAMTLVLMALR
ncbi:MAG TPA: hypothetical protein VLA17_13825, partial [Candidatus Limnocylindria bacterium]|nr:hypothetical protein [Candidatus Limnocylindria bacterium]